jgi:hypothetical protein
MDLTPLGEGCGVGSPELATTGSGVFGKLLSKPEILQNTFLFLISICSSGS